MGRKPTVSQDTVWYQARIKASAWNERLANREGAANMLGIDQSRLSKIERNLIDPYPEEVVMMAKDYHAPELTNYFCREVCPLGCDTPKADMDNLDRITVRALAVFRNLEITEHELLDVAADGKVSEEEEFKMLEVLSTLQVIEEVAQSLRIWVKKNMKGE